MDGWRTREIYSSHKLCYRIYFLCRLLVNNKNKNKSKQQTSSLYPPPPSPFLSATSLDSLYLSPLFSPNITSIDTCCVSERHLCHAIATRSSQSSSSERCCYVAAVDSTVKLNDTRKSFQYLLCERLTWKRFHLLVIVVSLINRESTSNEKK